jgi:hypothetical protein
MKIDRAKLTSELMGIRKDWVLLDFQEAYGDGEWDVIPETIQECMEKMEEHIYWTYDIFYIRECIENEKK